MFATAIVGLVVPADAPAQANACAWLEDLAIAHAGHPVAGITLFVVLADGDVDALGDLALVEPAKQVFQAPGQRVAVVAARIEVGTVGLRVHRAAYFHAAIEREVGRGVHALGEGGEPTGALVAVAEIVTRHAEAGLGEFAGAPGHGGFQGLRRDAVILRAQRRDFTRGAESAAMAQ